MGSKTPVPSFLIATKAIRDKTATIAASEAVKFFRESFVKEGFTDTAFAKWQKYQYKKKKGMSKRILFAQGHLKNSIKKRKVTTEQVVVAAEAVYADVHNSGGTINKSNGTKIKMPKRQFMGNSKALMDILEKKNTDIVRKEMVKAFKFRRVRF